MKERPILFSAPMVRAILDGSKTQTRRVINSEFLNGCEEDGFEVYEGKILGPELYEPAGYDKHGDMIPMPEIYGIYDEDGEFGMACPYGRPANQLWVRETWGEVEAKDGSKSLVYAADGWKDPAGYFRWKPSIHMYRWASRIQLEIVSVKIERLNDCSYSDAKAEGWNPKADDGKNPAHLDPLTWYKNLWNSINGAGSWDKNPWVWVVEFKRIKP